MTLAISDLPVIPMTVRCTEPTTETDTFDTRSKIMQSLHEAYVRERIRDAEQRARHARLANRLASERRCHRALLRRERRASS